MIPVKDNMPVDRVPYATLALIVANVVLFAVFSAPETVTAGTVVAAIFIHRSVLVLLGNIWFLWVFGNNVEDSMGPVRFLALYVAGGLVAIGVVLAIHPGLSVPPAGAGGAVAAVLGAYLLFYRGARVLSLSIIPFFWGAAEIPIPVMLAAWVAMQVAFAATGLIGGGTMAYLSWVGGLAVGVAAMRPLARRRKPVPPTRAAAA